MGTSAEFRRGTTDNTLKINAYFTHGVVVDSAALPWVPSPLEGVSRRMIERDGGEVARVTSLVRYAPGSHFSEHTHTGGEEYLVLDGTFSDQAGDFPAGTYVRNPVGSKHAPKSDGGCTILVKLWWMHPGDQEFVVRDTTQDSQWRQSQWQGVEAMALHGFGPEQTALYRFGPGAALPARELAGGEEFFMLDGACRDADGSYDAGFWVRHPAGATAPELISDSGCRLYIKRGHLSDPPPGPGTH